MLEVPFIDEQHYNMYMLCTLEWVCLVPLTGAHVVLVGVALFFVMHFLAPSDFHVRARANVCVSVYLSVCFVCVCVWCVGTHSIADQLFTIVRIMYSVLSVSTFWITQHTKNC